jgi:CarD family transcriptional regulator
MSSKKKAKSSTTQDTTRSKKKGKAPAKTASVKASATKAAARSAAKKPTAKSAAAKNTQAKNKADSAAKKPSTKTVASKPAAAKKNTAPATKSTQKNTAPVHVKDKNASTKAGAAKSKSTSASKPKEVLVTAPKPVASKKPAPKTASKPQKAAAEKPSVKENAIKTKPNKEVEIKAEPTITAVTTTGKSKQNAAAPQKQAAAEPNHKQKSTPKAATKKTVEPVIMAPVRPKIALASGSSAPQPAPQNQPAPQAANDQSKIMTEPKPIATKPAPTKNGVHRTGYRVNEYIVYPAHGVGQIIAIEEQEVAGFSLELFVVNFMKDKMTLKVPLPKVLAGAIRKLADNQTVAKALETLTGRARIKRTMWSRRAQEYEAKINSGDLVSIAEVVRDLYRSDTQPEQSYSERQLYEAALDRMMREIAAIEKLIDSEALKLLESYLQRGPKRGSKTETNDVADLENDDIDNETNNEGDVEEAA